MASAGGAGHQQRHRRPLRRGRPGRRHRGDGAHDRATPGVGHRPVPLLRPFPLRGRHRGGRRRRRPQGQPGAGHRPRGRQGDLHRQRRPGPARLRRKRVVGRAAGGAAARGVPGPAQRRSSRRHHVEPHRDAPGPGPAHGGAPWAAGRRAQRPVGPSPARGLGRQPGRRGRPGAVRHQPGSRQTGGGQQPRQHPAGRPPGADRMDAARRAHPGRGRRLRARARAPVGPGRHPVGHRQPDGGGSRMEGDPNR